MIQLKLIQLKLIQLKLKIKLKIIRLFLRDLLELQNMVKSSKTKTKKYHDYDDIEYKGIIDVKDMYDDIDEDYYKPIKINNAFNGEYIEYESNES